MKAMEMGKGIMARSNGMDNSKRGYRRKTISEAERKRRAEAKESARDELRDSEIKCILDAMEKDGVQWMKGILDAGPQRGLVSDHVFGCRNQLLCRLSAMSHGFSDPRWTTSAQAREKFDSMPVKGSRQAVRLFRPNKAFRVYDSQGSMLVKNAEGKGADFRFSLFSPLDPACMNMKPVTFSTESAARKFLAKHPELVRGEVRVKSYTYFTDYPVFNAEQMTNIPPLHDEIERKPLDPKGLQATVIEAAHFIFDSRDDTPSGKQLGLKIAQGDRAYLDLSSFEITIPDPALFLNSEMGFVRVLMHEMGHATGPALGRNQTGMFGSAEYAYEELVAEMCSAMTAMELGLSGEEFVDSVGQSQTFIENHAVYLAHWKQRLGEDPQLFDTAMKDAQAASAMLYGAIEKAAVRTGYEMDRLIVPELPVTSGAPALGDEQVAMVA
jgi:antirestriction protein ArdC